MNGWLNLKNVDLNLLVALEALLRERNVTRAGRAVGLSQPAMSATLARLRSLFDDALLQRVGREYQLTARAVELNEPLKVALGAIERTLERAPAFDPATAKRRFRISTSDYFLPVLCGPLVEHLRCVAPGIQLQLRQVTPTVGQDLTARRLDLTLQPAAFVVEAATQELFTDRWVCAVWRGHHTVKKRISAEQLCSLDHASFALRRNSLSERFLAPHLSAPVHVAVTSQSFMALPFLVRGTQLVTLVQHLLAVRLQEQAEIRILEPPVPIPKVVMGMSWNPVFTSDTAHTWLRRTLVEVAREHCRMPSFELA
jgi:LysR family transcriptional regulator, nod-box dependent transcriptional activator